MIKKVLFLVFSIFCLISYSQTYFPHKKNGKWGVYDKTTKEFYTTDFDSIAPFSQTYTKGFKDKHPFSIGFTKKYHKIINYKGEILLDSLLYASEIKIPYDDPVLKADYRLPLYKFSKNSASVYGYYYPQENQIVVPDKYQSIKFYFDPDDQNKLYYYGYDPKKKALDIFNSRDNKLVVSIPCDTYKFDDDLSSFFNRPKKLFIATSHGNQTSIFDFKGNQLIPKRVYKKIRMYSDKIIVDDQQYDLEGNFIKKLSDASEYEEHDGMEVEETVIEPMVGDEKLIDLGNNTFSIEGSNSRFKANKNWKDIELFHNFSGSKSSGRHIGYSTKTGRGVYSFKKKKVILDPKYKSIVLAFFYVNNNYDFFDTSLNQTYRSEESIEMFSVINNNNEFNFYDIKKGAFVFDNWHTSVSILENYDFESHHDYFLVENEKEKKFALYDFNGKLILDNIQYLYIDKDSLLQEGETHEVKTYDNTLIMDRYLYVRFTSGDSGYMYIDNKSWTANYLFPTN